MSKKIYLARLKTRKQIMAEIPREQQGWWADVCPGETLELRDATAADIGRCIINEGQSRDPADYLCETFKGGALVNRIAVAELAEIAPAAPVPASTGRELIEYRAGADDVWHSAPLSERESLVKDGFQVRALIVARELDVEAERREFEVWARNEWPDGSLAGSDIAGAGWYYFDDRANDFWQCWQARAARSATQGTQPESAPVSTEQAGDAWISVEDQLPEKECLAAYATPSGKVRLIRAKYARKFQIEAEGDDCETEYNEDDDTFYIKEGWLECIDNWGEYSSCYVVEGIVTHWMPLPAAPSPNNSPVGGKD